MSGFELLIADSWGIYVPQQFTTRYIPAHWGLPEGDPDWEYVSSGPEHEFYWDAWLSITDRAKHTDKNGNVWTLHQDGDLWAVCDELLTEDERRSFFGV